VSTIPESARAVLESSALAHLVTLESDGSPQVSIVWVGLDGDEIVAGHLAERRKVRNIRNDSRIVLSFETNSHNERGLVEYLVVHGRARISEGGAPELLQQLAHTYLGPDVQFPPPSRPNPVTSPISPSIGSPASDPGQASQSSQPFAAGAHSLY
jgi:PPOX class probable F420-dependent enzyme